MRVGYAKIGQRLELRERIGFAGATAPARLLRRLARRNPEVDWIVVGRHSGFTAAEWPRNVSALWPDDLAGKQPYHNAYQEGVRTLELVNPDVLEFEDTVAIPTIAELDACVLFLGSHTSGSLQIPKAGKTWDSGELMKPTEAMLNTGRYLIEGLNRLGDRTNGVAPIIWMIEDPRNTLSARDLKWPGGTGVKRQIQS